MDWDFRKERGKRKKEAEHNVQCSMFNVQCSIREKFYNNEVKLKFLILILFSLIKLIKSN